MENKDNDGSQWAVAYAFGSFLLVMILLHCCLKLQQRFRSGKKVKREHGGRARTERITDVLRRRSRADVSKDCERLLQSENGKIDILSFSDDDIIV